MAGYHAEKAGLKKRLSRFIPRCQSCGAYKREGMWSAIGISERDFFDFMNGKPVWGDAIERIRAYVVHKEEQEAEGTEPQQERS